MNIDRLQCAIKYDIRLDLAGSAESRDSSFDMESSSLVCGRSQMAANEPQNVSYKIATCTDAPLHNDTKTQSECINRIKYYYLLLFCYSVCVFSYAKDAAQRIKITFQLYTTDLESESRASRVLYRFAYF